MECRCNPWSIRDDLLQIQLADAGTLPLTALAWHWRCSDADLRMRCFAAKRLNPLPTPEPSEPVIGALARIQQWARNQHEDVVLMLDNPAQALGRDQMTALQGVRLIGIRSESDRSCWDAALSSGLPVYGVYQDICSQLTQPNAASFLTAISYGAFTSGDGVDMEHFEESPKGCRWRLSAAPDNAVSVVVKGGLEAATIEGPEGFWQDAGQEGYVRLEMHQEHHRRFSQPRLVANRSATTGEWGR